MTDESNNSTSSVENQTEDSPQEQVVQPEESDEVSGLKSAFEAEREKRQRLEAENEILRQYTQAGETQQEGQQYDPDDYPTNRTVQEMVQAELAKQRSVQDQASVPMQESVMRLQYPDYDEVINTELPKLLAKNPGLASALKAANNKAELAYDLGRTSPDYLNKLREEATKKAAETIDQNTNKPSTLTDSTGADVEAVIKKWENASDEELEKEARIRKGLPA